MFFTPFSFTIMKKSRISYLIPSKFLILLAHLTMLIIALHSKGTLIGGSLHPDQEDDDEYLEINTKYMIGLILAICFVAVEIALFLTGLTFFMPFLMTIEIILHVFGTITLAMCVIESWHIDTFWCIFWIGSVVPFSLEMIANIKHIIRNI